MLSALSRLENQFNMISKQMDLVKDKMSHIADDYDEIEKEVEGLAQIENVIKGQKPSFMDVFQTFYNKAVASSSGDSSSFSEPLSSGRQITRPINAGNVSETMNIFKEHKVFDPDLNRKKNSDQSKVSDKFGIEPENNIPNCRGSQSFVPCLPTFGY